MHISNAVLAPFDDSKPFEHRSVNTSASDNVESLLLHIGNTVIG